MNILQLALDSNKIQARLLKIAAEKFSNHGCNDLPDGFWDGISEEAKQYIIRLWNEGEHEDDHISSVAHIRDDMLMSLIAKTLEP